MKAAKKLMAKKRGVRTPKTKNKYARPLMPKQPKTPGSFQHFMSYEEGGSVQKKKVDKVVKGLKKASKLHAGQAKTLKTLKFKEGGKTKSKVNESGNYTKPGLRKRIFNRIKAGGKGGAPGHWSARKAQMMASAYKKAGGGYKD